MMPSSQRIGPGALKNWLEVVLSYFYPPVCQICGEAAASPAEGYICRECAGGPSGVKRIEPPYCQKCGLPFEGEMTTQFECGNCLEMDFAFAFARAAVLASPLVLEVVHRYKYKRALWFEPFLSRLLIERAASELIRGDWDCIVPVPLHPLKQREREFNQAERLARQLSAATGLPMRKDILQRRTYTETQTALSRSQRSANMRGAFALRRRKELAGEKIILVDDVLTTGATTGACAKALMENGAGAVGVWTVARGRWT